MEDNRTLQILHVSSGREGEDEIARKLFLDSSADLKRQGMMWARTLLNIGDGEESFVNEGSLVDYFRTMRKHWAEHDLKRI